MSLERMLLELRSHSSLWLEKCDEGHFPEDLV